ncbi:SH3 domain-containing protein 19-like isoform X2 [Channa argus]|uniref:SH3 domain-containing protein 19-like isoform X2 n=1 Tax=Channa argus TaxID=215402 RepID=UPI003520C118
MAEARSEEDEENMMRDTREQVVRRQPNRGRPDRRKPENRHSQGPLSSIRAVIKRTSTRSTSLSETSRDRDRERDRERDRDRRRPEITILSAEPLSSTSWFPGASAGFPPPPPPAAQIWGSTIPPSIQAPPSYEEVIREKTQEQVLLPSSSTSCSSSSSLDLVSTTTIATQTDPGSAPDSQDSKVRQPLRPPRPPLPYPPKYSHADDVNTTVTTTSQSTLTSQTSDSVVPNTLPEKVKHTTSHTQCCELLNDFCSPLTSTTGAQTDQTPAVVVEASPATSPHVVLERPRPRPRTKLGARPISNEVKVQTLVKLREDGLATIAARAGSDCAIQGVSQGKYFQELLEAFSSDDWGFPECRSDSSDNSQSESDERDEAEEEAHMATLKARIQAFEQQQQQQVGDESCGENNNTDLVGPKRPEPKPRPRLQGQPAKSVPPTIAPKPKNVSSTPKPSSKGFWEEGGLEPTKTPSTDINPKPQTTPEASPSSIPRSTPPPQSCKSSEKPSVTPKPQSATEAPPSSFPSPASAPVPAPRPLLPKLTPSFSDLPSSSNPKPPPRPAAAPRASMGSPHTENSISAGNATPSLPPRPLMEISRSKTESQAGSDETQDTTNQPVKVGSVRPGILNKPAVLISPRRASAPTLAPKPSGASTTPPDLNPIPAKSAAATPGPAPRPLGLTPAPVPGLKPPSPAPAPALRKGPVIQSKAEAASTANSTDPPLPPRPSSAKFLPLRPPPMKSTPERPPPPVINLTSNLIPAASKTSPASSVGQSGQTGSSPPSVTASQTQRVPKRGPPLPPRPKPGHPLYNSYVKQEVLIVLDDASPTPSEHLSVEGKSQTPVTPLISQSQCLLDLDTQPDPVLSQDSQSKPAFENLSLLDSESILPLHPTEQKEQQNLPPLSGPRCRALFDFEGEDNDELTFSQGDFIALLELISEEWGRGQIHGRIGIFPLKFTKVVEPLPPVSSPGETMKTTSTNTAVIETPKSCENPNSKAGEWVVALFDFPGQTPEDLSFQKGAMIHVTEHIDAEWRRGRLDGREGLYPAAFTQPCQVQPVPGQQPAVKGVAKALFDFTAESQDELTLKVGDIISHVESVDEQWMLGVVDGKRGMVPKNYISLL